MSTIILGGNDIEFKYWLFFAGGIAAGGIGYLIGRSLAPPDYKNYKYLLFGIKPEAGAGTKVGAPGTGGSGTSNQDPTKDQTRYLGDIYLSVEQNSRLNAAFFEWKNRWGDTWTRLRAWRYFKGKNPGGSVDDFIKALHDLTDPKSWATGESPNPSPKNTTSGTKPGASGPTTVIASPIPGLPPITVPADSDAARAHGQVQPTYPPAGTDPYRLNDPQATPQPKPKVTDAPPFPKAPSHVSGLSQMPLVGVAQQGMMTASDQARASNLYRRLEDAWRAYQIRYSDKVGGVRGWSKEQFWAAYYHRVPTASFDGFARFLEQKSPPGPIIQNWTTA